MTIISRTLLNNIRTWLKISAFFTLQPGGSRVEIVVSLLENLDNPHHIITSVFIETFTHYIEEMV